MIPVVGFFLNGANLLGYFKCRKDAGTQIRNMAGKFIGQQIIKQVCTRHALGARMSHTCTIHKATCKLNCASSIKQVRTRHAL